MEPLDDNWKLIKTVKDLRELIEGLPDDRHVYLYGVSLDTVYDLEAQSGQIQCFEHNGKRWIADGVVFQSAI